MRNTEGEIIDVEFRVFNRSRWESWMRQLPSTQECSAFVLLVLAALVTIGGVLTGSLTLALGIGCAIAGIGCLLTSEHKGKGLAAMAVAALLATTGCSDAAVGPATAPASSAATSPDDVHSSIREATRYRNPREGWTPKPMPIPGGTAAAQERSDEGR